MYIYIYLHIKIDICISIYVHVNIGRASGSAPSQGASKVGPILRQSLALILEVGRPSRAALKNLRLAKDIQMAGNTAVDGPGSSRSRF